MISLDLTRKSFGAIDVLGPLSLRILPGEVVGLSGASGAGKTTLMRIIAGLDTRYAGHREVEGRLSMVFQNPTLMPWRTVRDNIMIPTGCGMAHALDVLAQVGLAGLGDRYPAQISVGQARRVGIARAFARPPQALVLDEPFVSLDHDRVAELMDLTEDLILRHRPAVILASHDPQELARLATRHVHLSGRPARLSEVVNR